MLCLWELKNKFYVIIIYAELRKEVKKMIDYIKLLNENNLNLGIIKIVLVIVFILLFISIICYIFIVQEEILEIIFCFFVFVLFAGFYYGTFRN